MLFFPKYNDFPSHSEMRPKMLILQSKNNSFQHMDPNDQKIIFSMVGVSKTIPQNNRQLLKNIYLSFFYGAKIGIIGLNGAGKSTLMKIIAGIDKQYKGVFTYSDLYSSASSNDVGAAVATS